MGRKNQFVISNPKWKFRVFIAQEMLFLAFNLIDAIQHHWFCDIPAGSIPTLLDAAVQDSSVAEFVAFGSELLFLWLLGLQIPFFIDVLDRFRLFYGTQNQLGGWFAAEEILAVAEYPGQPRGLMSLQIL